MAASLSYICAVIVLCLALVSSSEARRTRRHQFPKIGDLSHYHVPLSNGMFSNSHPTHNLAHLANHGDST